VDRRPPAAVVRVLRGEPAEEEGRDEEGRDEAPDGERERGGRSELERRGFSVFFFIVVVVIIFLLLLLMLLLLPGDAPSPDPFAGQEEDGGVDEVELDRGDLEGERRRRKKRKRER